MSDADVGKGPSSEAGDNGADSGINASVNAGAVLSTSEGAGGGSSRLSKANEKLARESAEKRRRGIIRAAFTRRQGFVVGTGLIAGLIGSYIALGFCGARSSVASAALLSLSVVILLANGPGLRALTPGNKRATVRPISRGLLWLWCFVAITLAQMGWQVLDQFQGLSLARPAPGSIIETSMTKMSSSETTSRKVQ